MARKDDGQLTEHKCECGCDKFTRMWYGKPAKFIHGHNYRGINNPRYKGYKDNYDGRKMLNMPWHPNAGKDGYVYEYVWIMTRLIKRPLNLKEVVHHKDGNFRNNDPLNLMLLENQGVHMSLTRKIDKSDRFCSKCESKKTLTDKKGYESWYDDGSRGFLCRRCYTKKIYKYEKKKKE